jgi:hypothetical protein
MRGIDFAFLTENQGKSFSATKRIGQFRFFTITISSRGKLKYMLAAIPCGGYSLYYTSLCQRSFAAWNRRGIACSLLVVRGKIS